MSHFSTIRTNHTQLTVDLNSLPTRGIANPAQRNGDSRPGRIFELEKPWIEPQNNGGAK